MEKSTRLVIENNVSLKPYNTFGLDVKAKNMIHVKTEEEIPELLRLIASYPGKVMFVGGGSNVLFTQDYDGLVIKIETKGIEVIEEDDEHVYIRAAAGEIWDDLVQFSIKRGFSGLENLSLIPGTVGSSPIQNIGAYGVELKDSFYMLEAVSLRTGEVREFYKNECQFDYRYSVFKGVYKGVYLILSVIFELKKKQDLNISYGAIKEEMDRLGLPYNVESVSQAIINIRRCKLPDPESLGNAGSFFKNPVIEKAQFEVLHDKYPGMKYFKTDDGYKIAAGWLIESKGWKGYREGDAGVHEMQALVLVNYGKANGLQIKALSEKIASSVFEEYGILLEPEVNII